MTESSSAYLCSKEDHLLLVSNLSSVCIPQILTLEKTEQLSSVHTFQIIYHFINLCHTSPIIFFPAWRIEKYLSFLVQKPFHTFDLPYCLSLIWKFFLTQYKSTVCKTENPLILHNMLVYKEVGPCKFWCPWIKRKKKRLAWCSRQAQISWNVTFKGNEKSVTWPMQSWGEDLEHFA